MVTIGPYKLGQTLGVGTFGKVKVATHTKTDQKVAIKIIDKAKVEDMGDIEREIKIMESLDHPNIVKLYEIFDEKTKMHLVMELVTGGELFDRIVARGNYTEKDAASTMETLCGALEFLHAKNIVHRDLKPANCLLKHEASILKVTDFNSATEVGQGEGSSVMLSARGTHAFSAPEISLTPS